jgi:DNA repair protein RecO (recombination protein O)
MSAEKRLQDECFVLHTYPYQETSFIVEAFSRHHGRIALVAKGARRPRSGMRGLIRQFQPMLLSWFGKSELRTLAAAEWVVAHTPLRGLALLCGFYLNELLLKLIAREDAHEQLYDVYRALLPQLSQTTHVEPLLRGFELALLRELGYALSLVRTADTDEAVQAQRSYGFSFDRGPLAHIAGGDTVKFLGKTFLDMDCADYSDPVTSQQSKQLMRAAINHHLNGQPLHTRQLLRDLQAL